MIIFHAKRDGTVTTEPSFVPFGSSMDDLVVLSEFDYALCTIRLTPASGLYIPDVVCNFVLTADKTTVWTASMPPEVAKVAGTVEYQLIFTAADGTQQGSLRGTFTVPKGAITNMPDSVDGLSQITVNELYSLLSNVYAAFVGLENPVARLLANMTMAGKVIIPASAWTDATPTIATFSVPTLTNGQSVIMLPANDATKQAAISAKLSAFPAPFTSVGSSTIELVRAEAETAPTVDMTFVYLVTTTESTDTPPVIALIGVDAYGEGGSGAASGVDEAAVKALIKSTMPAWSQAANPPAETDPTISDWAKAKTKPTYTAAEVKARPDTWMPTAEEVGARPITWTPTATDVGADPSGTAASKVSSHNTQTDAHNDIRILLQNLSDRLGALAALLNSDDITLDETKEIVAYIKDNKALIDSITTSKINVTDIIDNLTTNVTNKPLSAAQGVALKSLIDALTATVEGKQTAEQVTTAINNALSVYLTASKASELYQPKGDYLTEHQSLAHLLPINQGAENAGMILVVGEDGNLTLTDMPTGDAAISGRVDEIDGAPVLILEGAVPVGSYKAYYAMEDGTLVEIGDLTLSEDTPLETYTVTFVADGVTVAVVEYTEGDTTLSNIPEVPTKDGYTGAWETFDITNGGNITVNAIYTEIPANTYTVTKNPTYCTINGDDTVTEGEAYTANVTANEGYELSSVTVTMGGTDITASAYDGAGNINIASVTGNVAITATATKVITNWLPISTDESGNKVGWIEGYRLSTSTGEAQQKTGVNATGFIPVQYNDTVLISNAAGITGGTDPHICFYNSDKEKLVNGVKLSTIFTETADVLEGVLNSSTLSTLTSELKYIRISSSLLTADTIINIKRNGEWL